MSRDLVQDALRRELLETFGDPEFRPPPLPSVALELFALTRRHDAKVEDVVALLEKDAMLAGDVMRLVSSPVYTRRSPVKSLTQAVVRLGLRTLRDIVFEAVLGRGVFNLPDYRETVEQVRRHSTVVAYVARIIAEHARVAGDDAFLCGLFHDIGFAALLYAVGTKDTKQVPRLVDLWADFDRAHERAGALVVGLWHLPANIAEVVGHHHHLFTGDEATTAAAVCLADDLSGRFGASVIGPQAATGELLIGDAADPIALETSRALLGVDEVSPRTWGGLGAKG